MSVKEEQDILKITQSSINGEDERTIAYYESAHSDIETYESDPAKHKFSKKHKLFRTGAASILEYLFDVARIDENIVEIASRITASPAIRTRKNVARRGKPFRSQANRRSRIVDFKQLNCNPETFTELVLERNFCHSLLNNKDIPIKVKIFIESRLPYTEDRQNFKKLLEMTE